MLQKIMYITMSQLAGGAVLTIRYSERESNHNNRAEQNNASKR